MAYKLPRIEAAIQMVDTVSAPMRKINQSIESALAPVNKLSNALGSLSREARLDKLAASAGKMKDKLGGIGDGFSSSVSRLGGVLAGGGAVAVGLGALVKGSADAADTLNDTAQAVGVSTDMLQRWRYAAQLSGSSVETMDAGLERFTKNLSAASAGSGEALQPLQAMGVRLRTNSGVLRSQESVLLDVVSAMEKIPNAQDRLRISGALFGKGNQRLVTTLSQGRGALGAVFEEFDKMGAGFKQKDIAAAAAFNDQFDRATFAVRGLAFQFSAQLFPVLTELLSKFTNWVGSNQELIGSIGRTIALELPGFLKNTAAAFLSAAESVAPLARAVGGIIKVVGPLPLILGGLAAFIAGPLVVSVLAAIPAFLSFATALTTTGVVVGGVTYTTIIPALLAVAAAALPFVAAAAAIGTAAFLIYKYWEPIKNFFADLWKSVVGGFTAAWEKISGLMKAHPVLAAILTGGQSLAVTGNPFGPATAGETSKATAAAATTRNTVTRNESSLAVSFNNLPAGARVGPLLGSAPVDISAGYQLAGGF